MRYPLLIALSRRCAVTCVLFLLSRPFEGRAAEFFIRLTDSGFARRMELIQSEAGLNTVLQKAVPGSAQRMRFAPVLRTGQHPSGFSRWLVLSITDSSAEAAISEMKSAGMIDHAEAVGRLRCHPSDTDSLIAQQWHLAKIDAYGAWAKSEGSPDIIVGVIDTGVDYNHPDLQGSLWINTNERYGAADVDDDGNGFVDDVMGWDFTNAPRFPDGGDYLDEDNDPMDEFSGGHGTEVAGIIAAQTHNQIGIAGVAPGVRVMNLRAGTAAGYLEEDDVARAIIYAVDNGARIINMSFGDVALSRLLREVIYYASQQGVALVASAGNSGTNEINYPAGLAETIAVAASTESDGIAGFSCFGDHIDLAAPGVNILCTAAKGGYTSVNGTSFSAPIVSALAALCLSVNPGWSAERVRNALKTSADDIFYHGWDEYSGAGRVNAKTMINVPHSGILQIDRPVTGSSMAGDEWWITGSSVHPDLLVTSLTYGLGKNPDRWQNLWRGRGQQVFGDTLGRLDTQTLADTTITIRLQQEMIGGGRNEVRSSVELDRTAPEIGEVSILPVFSGPHPACRISFRTDDVCRVSLVLKDADGNALPSLYEPGYEANNHTLLINRFDEPVAVFFEITATNRGGLFALDNASGEGHRLQFEPYPAWQNWLTASYQLPAGYLLDKMTDLDHNGLSEIVMSRYTPEGGFGPIEVYEFGGQQFSCVFSSSFIAIPRDAGDVDKDGLSDLLLGYGDKSFLLEARNPNSFPDLMVWSDTTHFWATAFGDADHDGLGEIYGRNDSQYVILEIQVENIFNQVATLDNPASGSNQLGVPKIVQTDLDGDGWAELIFGDYDGDLLAYRNTGDNQYELLATARTALQDATALLAAADGMIMVVSHSHPAINYEHESESRYQSLEQFNYKDGSLVSTDTMQVFGYHDLRDFDSGLNLHHIGDDLYLFAALYPDLYVFKHTGGQWRAVFYRDHVASNAIAAAQSGVSASPNFFFNTGDEIIGCLPDDGNTVAPPVFLQANALDSARVGLQWSSVTQAASYRIYRGIKADSLELITSAGSDSFTDSFLFPEQTYYYAVSSVFEEPVLKESAPSPPVAVRTSYPPRLIGLETTNSRQLTLIFNEAIDLTESYDIHFSASGLRAGSAAELSQPERLLVGFGQQFTAPFTDTIVVGNIFDEYGVPVDRNFSRLAFHYQPESAAPYIIKFELLDRRSVRILFNEQMALETLLNPANYVAEPGGEVETVTLADSNDRCVDVELPIQAMAGGLGKASYLVMNNLRNAAGVELKEGNRIHLYQESNSLDELIVYPQPLKPSHREVIFAKTPPGAQVLIFSINGMLIRKLEEEAIFGGIHWNLQDDSGNSVHSGIYIYRIVHQSGSKNGKLVIVR